MPPDLPATFVAYILVIRSRKVEMRETQENRLFVFFDMIREANAGHPDHPVKASLFREERRADGRLERVLLATWGGTKPTRDLDLYMVGKGFGMADFANPEELPEDGGEADDPLER